MVLFIEGYFSTFTNLTPIQIVFRDGICILSQYLLHISRRVHALEMALYHHQLPHVGNAAQSVHAVRVPAS